MTLTKNQKAVFNYIVNYTKENGNAPTQREIKDHFGLKSYGSVQKYLSYLLEAGLLKKDWNARRGLELATKSDQNKKAVVDLPITTDSTNIPLLGKIAAGLPLEAIENPEETVDIPNHLMSRGGGTHYALEVVGDSMIELGIMPGDTAIIRYQQVANRGQIIVALVDGEATLKTYIPHKDAIELRPANSNMPTILIPNGMKEVKIAGILTGLLRSYQ